ncbi:MAG: TIR domain-containing protein [Chloroflexota bacterium]
MSAFISYSRTNSAFAVRLAKDLKSAGYDVWLDQLDIATGTRWDDEIEIALEACTTFMIVLSPESMQSQNVKDEIGFAIDAGKDILPVRIKSGDIPLRLRRFQYVDFTNRPYEDSLKEMKSLLTPTGQLVTSEASGKERDARTAVQKTRPLRSEPITQIRKPLAKQPEATGSPVRKIKVSKGLLVGMVAIMALGIAGIVISSIGNADPPAVVQPTASMVVENLPIEQPTAKPTVDTTQIAALTQQAQSEIFITKFVESTDLSDWEQFVVGEGRRNKVTILPSNDGLEFNLSDPDLHVYYAYKPVVYKDVAIRIKAENLGQNANNVGIVCRRTGNSWYEFSVTGGGEWKLYNYNAGYAIIDNGGSMAIKTGKSINEYEMLCVGDEISLRINGQTVSAFSPKNNTHSEGQVGFNISSSNVFPIDIRMIEFEVSNPSSGSTADSTLSSTETGTAITP